MGSFGVGGSAESELRAGRRLRRAGLALAVVLAVVAPACNRTSPGSGPLVHGPVGFDIHQATAEGFPPPRANVGQACGSSHAQYGAELLSTPPQKAKVGNEWGPIVLGTQPVAAGVGNRGLSGARMPAEGVVTHGHLDTRGGFFAGDLPFTHPFGKDYTTDIRLDAQFAGLAQTLGSARSGIPRGSIHSELPSGLFPHTGANVLPGFLPRDGDRMATAGTWVIDCGHPDYHTEIHDMEFLAFGHSRGSTTVAHAFAVPYDVANLFTTDPSLATRFSSSTRFLTSTSQPIGPYLFNLLVGIATGSIHADHLFEHDLVVPTQPRWPSWYVCAPPGSRGTLSFSSRFTVRPGVFVVATPLHGVGCVRFEAVATASFRPERIRVGSCPISWSDLQRVATESGLGRFDVRKAIAEQAPSGFQSVLRPVIRHDPVFDCFAPFRVPPPGGPSGRPVDTVATQPFPFYGEVTVTRR